MAEPKFSDWRVFEFEGGVYVIRDILPASGQCQYAVKDGDDMAWRPCVEGVMFADIQPLARLTK